MLNRDSKVMLVDPPLDKITVSKNEPVLLHALTMSIATVYHNTRLNTRVIEKGIIDKIFGIKDCDLAPHYYTTDFSSDELRAHSVRILLSRVKTKGLLFFLNFTFRNLRQSGLKTGFRYIFNWASVLARKA